MNQNVIGTPHLSLSHFEVFLDLNKDVEGAVNETHCVCDPFDEMFYLNYFLGLGNSNCNSGSEPVIITLGGCRLCLPLTCLKHSVLCQASFGDWIYVKCSSYYLSGMVAPSGVIVST